MKRILIVYLLLFIIAGCSSSSKKVDTTKMDYFDAVKAVVEQELKNKASNFEYKEAESTVTVRYLVTESMYDETAFVNNSFSHYVNICRELYDRSDAKNLYFYIDGTIVDGKGNEETRTLIYLDMHIENFKTYNWENLKYRDLNYNTVASDCEIFMIKRPIVNYWDESKFQYKG